MLHFIRLIRWPNQLIIILTFVLIRYGIIQPYFVVNGLSLEFPLFLFMLLVFSIVCIASAGYIINDYFDLQIDQINKPEKVIIGKYISPSTAYRYYFILNGIALLSAFYITYRIGFISIFIIFPVASGILWFYSTTYKRQLITGNIIIAFFAGIVPILPAIFELPPVLSKYYSFIVNYELNPKVVLIWCLVFSIFAFLTNLIREVVKDCEDYEGDMTNGRKTIPIKFGLMVANVIVLILILLIIFILQYVFFSFLRIGNDGKFDYFTLGYFLILISLPLLYAGVIIFRSARKEIYARASLIIKLVMVAGALYAIVVRMKIL